MESEALLSGRRGGGSLASRPGPTGAHLPRRDSEARVTQSHFDVKRRACAMPGPSASLPATARGGLENAG